MKNIQIILNAILSKEIFDYILIDRSFRVTGASEGVVRYLSAPLKNGDEIFVHLPELVGREAEIEAIFADPGAQIRLETIQKNDHYIDLSVEHYDASTVLMLVHNVTAATRARQGVLQKSNEATLLYTMLQKIIDAQGALLFVVDREGKIEFANRQFYRHFGEREPQLYRHVNTDLTSYAQLCDYLDDQETHVTIGEDTFLLQASRIEATHMLFTLSKVTRIVRENTDLLEEVQYDTLTGVYRKKAFDVKVSEWMQRGDTFVLVVADIDNFKAINDRYGHAAGDAVLQEFAATIKRNLRSNDLVARWGGEEFIIALNISDPNEARRREDAMRRTEALREEIARHTFPHVGQLTVSMGLSWRSFCVCETLDMILLRADKALYAAKNRGKNRVAVTPPLSCGEMCSARVTDIRI